MLNGEVKDVIVESLKIYGLKQTLTLYGDVICSSSTIRKLSASGSVTYPHVYDINTLQKEYDNIQLKPGSYTMFCSNNKNVYHFMPHFYGREMQYLSDTNNYKRLLLNRRKYLFKQDINMVEMLRGCRISGAVVGYSHFNHSIIKKFIQDYSVTSVYDPCGGWGHRLLGSGKTPYIYNDIWNKSVEGVRRMVTSLNLPNKVMYNNDCTSFTPPDDYDALFTCPPYYNKEVYSSSFDSLDHFQDFVRKLVLMGFTKKASCRVLGIVICGDYIDIVKDAVGGTTNIIPLIKTTSHFNRSNKTTGPGEYLVVSIK